MKTKNILKANVAIAAIITVLGLISPAHSDTLLATVGSFSSEAFNQAAYGPSNLFDGTPVVGSASGLGSDYASNGEENPVVTFDLGGLRSLSGLDYAERPDAQNNPSNGGADGVAQIDLYFVSKSTYNSFTPTYGSTPASVTLALGVAPSEVIMIPTEPQTQMPTNPNTPVDNGDTIIPTSLDFDNYTFASGPATTEYVIAQFVGVDQTPMGIPANPGGAELRFVGSDVPEPRTFALLGLGLAGLIAVMRSRGALKL